MKTHWRATCGAAFLFLFAVPETARAQTSSFDDLAARLKQHETIVVTDTSGQPVTGRLLNLTSASIELALDGAGARSIDRASVGRIAIKDPIRNGAIIGAIAGLIPGVVGGLLINAICINETGACPGAPLLLGALGAGGGAKPVETDLPPIAVEFRDIAESAGLRIWTRGARPSR